MRLIIVRHGATWDNAAGIVQGRRPSSLSDKGKDQALRVAHRLRAERFEAVYTSDSDRALETTAILIKGREVNCVADPKLRERSFGIFEGKPIRRLMRQMKRSRADFTTLEPPGGESARSFRSRVQEFLSEIMEKHPLASLCVVTHYGVINTMLDILACPTNEIMNCSVTVLDLDQGGNARIEAINCTKHLL